MSHVHYEEEQRFTQLRWIWIVSLVLFIIPLLQITLNNQANEKSPYLILLTIGVGYIPLLIILLVTKFSIRVDSSGLHYKFIPKIFNWRTIAPDEIDSLEIVNKRGLYDCIACGYRKYIFKKLIFMNIVGSKFAIIKLKSGIRLKIGTQNPKSFHWAINRLLNPKED